MNNYVSKALIAMSFILVCSFSFAQKVKIKRGKVLFDKVEIGLLDTKTRDFFKFSHLDGTKAFDAQYIKLETVDGDEFEYLKLEDANGKVTEIPYEMLITSFSFKKVIINLLKEKYKLFNNQGFNNDGIDAFFSKEREVLTDKYKAIALEQEQAQAERQKIVDAYKPYVLPNGNILIGGKDSDKIVGKASINASGSYFIYDLDGIKIAETKPKKSTFDKFLITNTYKGETYKFRFKDNMVSGFDRDIAQKFAESLVGRKYNLGREAKNQATELRKEEIAIARENSINIYDLPGKLTDKKGDVYEGKVTAILEELPIDAPENPNGNIVDLDGGDTPGKSVTIKYVNEKGKNRVRRALAKSNTNFCVEKDGKTVCYYGMKTKGNAISKIANAGSFSFDNSFFYELVEKVDKHMLLKKPGTNTYVIKLEDKKVGFMIDARNNEKLSKALSKYLEGCSELQSEVLKEDFDLKNKGNLLTILKEYNNCKSTKP